jgi:HD-GYP domain-containing protein (c-di-GMP phosphodiesterase class II)
MTSARPYRDGRSFEEARETITAGAGSQFSPEIVEAFLRVSEDAWREIRARFDAPPKGAIALDVTQWRP